MKLLIFSLIISLNLNVIFGENTTLLFLQILFRHGDRAPVLLYQNDPNPVEYWSEGLGKLTMLGRKQHYILGKHLRSMYEDFITSNPNEVVAFSTEEDRCIRSAQMTLSSFYAPDSNWTIDDQLKWQPIPVFYLPEKTDKYLSPLSYCPLASEETKSVSFSPEVQKLYNKHQEMFKNLTEYAGKDITNFIDALLLYDCLLIEKKYNLIIPHWVEPFWDELEELSDEFFFWIYNTALQHRLRAGPFLKRLIELMLKKLDGHIPKQKVQIYSGHDATIAAVLSALQIHNGKRPPYCSTLLFELHENINKEKLIRLLYLNSTHPEMGFEDAHILKLNGCSEFCPIGYFINYTNDIIPDNWDLECKEDQTLLQLFSSKKISTSLLLVILVALVTSILLIAFMLWRRTCNKNKRQ